LEDIGGDGGCRVGGIDGADRRIVSRSHTDTDTDAQHSDDGRSRAAGGSERAAPGTG
jgi:hypothetical protein